MGAVLRESRLVKQVIIRVLYLILQVLGNQGWAALHAKATGGSLGVSPETSFFTQVMEIKNQIVECFKQNQERKLI